MANGVTAEYDVDTVFPPIVGFNVHMTDIPKEGDLVATFQANWSSPVDTLIASTVTVPVLNETIMDIPMTILNGSRLLVHGHAVTDDKGRLIAGIHPDYLQYYIGPTGSVVPATQFSYFHVNAIPTTVPTELVATKVYLIDFVYELTESIFKEGYLSLHYDEDQVPYSSTLFDLSSSNTTTGIDYWSIDVDYYQTPHQIVVDWAVRKPAGDYTAAGYQILDATESSLIISSLPTLDTGDEYEFAVEILHLPMFEIQMSNDEEQNPNGRRLLQFQLPVQGPVKFPPPSSPPFFGDNMGGGAVINWPHSMYASTPGGPSGKAGFWWGMKDDGYEGPKIDLGCGYGGDPAGLLISMLYSNKAGVKDTYIESMYRQECWKVGGNYELFGDIEVVYRNPNQGDTVQCPWNYYVQSIRHWDYQWGNGVILMCRQFRLVGNSQAIGYFSTFDVAWMPTSLAKTVSLQNIIDAGGIRCPRGDSAASFIIGLNFNKWESSAHRPTDLGSVRCAVPQSQPS